MIKIKDMNTKIWLKDERPKLAPGIIADTGRSWILEKATRKGFEVN